MAVRGNPAKLRPWKKGQSGNPLGGKLHDPVKRMIRNLTLSDVKEVASLIFLNDVKSLKKIADEQKGSVLKIWVASIAVKAIEKGDVQALNSLLDRLIGKVKEQIELTGNDGGPLKYENMEEAKLAEREKEILTALKNLRKNE